jgi:uncharacterized protein
MRFLSRTTPFIILASALVLGAGSLLNSTPPPARAQSTETRKITVNGTGTVYTAPDVAYLQVGVDIRNADLSAAMKEADTKMNAVLAALKKAGIADADIQTVQYSIYRDTPFEGQPGSGGEPSAVYHVVNVVRITVRTIANVGDVLNTAINAGANVVNNVDFGVLNAKTSETQARKAALDDARARATELATNVGGTLGQVVSVQETGIMGPIVNAADAKAVGGGGPAIVGGSLQVTIGVVVTYELK